MVTLDSIAVLQHHASSSLMSTEHQVPAASAVMLNLGKHCMQDESIMRKKYFNMMEDMKGKIRVYARVRPMLEFERSRGQKEALIIPDELSLEHMWKDKKREFSFDAVFSPSTSQDKVWHDANDGSLTSCFL